jgi:hypothetical protein
MSDSFDRELAGVRCAVLLAHLYHHGQIPQHHEAHAREILANVYASGLLPMAEITRTQALSEVA